MRLLHTIAGGAVGGAEEFFVRLAVALHRAGLDQKVVMRPNDSRGLRLEDAGVAVAHLPFGGLLDGKTVPGLVRVLDGFRPDIALCWMSRAAAMTTRAVARAVNRPVSIARLGGYYDLKYYRGCDHLVGNTPDIVRYLVDGGWDAGRAHFVPNFVDAASGAPLSRMSLGVPKDAPLLLAAGRLHPNKAFDVLIEAMGLLDGVHLLLAGDGGEAASLAERARALGIAGRVHMLGWRSDIADLMATADMLVCPSRIEPLGNVVIEAWARRLPVVAAASAGPAWLIRHGEDGLLMPVEDSVALAAAVRQLVGDPALAGRIAAAGRRRFEDGFTEEAVVGRYLALFRQVLG